LEIFKIPNILVQNSILVKPLLVENWPPLDRHEFGPVLAVAQLMAFVQKFDKIDDQFLDKLNKY
jgi:hypothetical protein